MVISRPAGPERDVPFQSVARPLMELFRPHGERIHLDVLRPPTFEQLARDPGREAPLLPPDAFRWARHISERR